MSEIDLQLEHQPSTDSRRQRDTAPHLYMPAMPPLGLIRWLYRRLDAWRFRRKLIRLLTYDDHMLDDMGHTRAELMMAIQLPLNANAREALRVWKAERRSNG